LPITIFLFLLTLAAGMLPYGGVAFWARTLVGLLCLTLAGQIYLSHRLHDAPMRFALPKSWLFRAFLVWLAGLTIFLGVQSVLHKSGGGLSTLSSTLFLWLCYGLLAAAIRAVSGSTTMLIILARTVAIIGTLQAMIGIVGLYTPMGVYSEFIGGSRAAGTFSSGNSFGGFLALSLPPTLLLAQQAFIHAFKHVMLRKALILHDAKREDYCLLPALLGLMATLVQALALLLSGSRGALCASLFALCALCLWLVFNRDPDRNENRLPMAASMLTLLLILALGAGGTYALTLRRIQELSTVQETALPRTEIWSATWQLIRSSPLGIGPGGYPAEILRFQPIGYGGKRINHAHNDYLELMAETGIPGFLLLMTATVLLLGSTVKRLCAPQEGQSTWVRRAALLSVTAGLIHAGVDFNLYSRPGVSLLFFTLLGMAISRRWQPAPGSKNRLTSWCFALLAILLTANQIRLAVADLKVERNVGSINGKSSLYFWLSTPSYPDAEALDHLLAARRLAPDLASVHLKLSRADVITGDRIIERFMQEAREKTTDLLPEELEAYFRPLLRVDEKRFLESALGHVDQAIRRAPNHADAYAQAAHIHARLASLEHDADRRINAIQKTLEVTDTARALAPHDATVHRLLLETMALLGKALADAQTPALTDAARQRGIAIGLHLLRLGGEPLAAILSAWDRMAIEPIEALDATTVPLHMEAAGQLYQFYNSRQHVTGAMRALDALEAAIASESLSQAGFRKAAQDASVIERHRMLLVRERALWSLRNHQFAAYRKHASQYESLLNHEINETLKRSLPHEQAALRFRYLNLQTLYETRGLDPAHAQELATLMRQHGEREAVIENLLMPYRPETQKDILADRQDATNSPAFVIGMQLLGGRIEFCGFSIMQDTLQTFWRFRSTVPSDLQMVVHFRDRANETVASASARFTEAFGRSFGVGSPALDQRYQADVKIPATAVLGESMSIGLRRLSNGRWFLSSEGLPHGEFYDWQKLRQPPSSDPQQGL